jgi:hypothetical protein
MRRFLGAACGLAVACAVWTDASAQPSPDAPLPATPERLALAQRLVDASGAKANIEEMMDLMATQFAKSIQTSSDSKLSTYLGQVIREELLDFSNKFSLLYSEIYAKSFTDSEMNALLTFYESPTGRMFVARTPEVERQAQLAVAPLIPAMQRDMVEKIFDHVCDLEHCTARQRGALTAAKAKMLERLDQQAAPPPP